MIDPDVRTGIPLDMDSLRTYAISVTRVEQRGNHLTQLAHKSTCWVPQLS